MNGTGTGYGSGTGYGDGSGTGYGSGDGTGYNEFLACANCRLTNTPDGIPAYQMQLKILGTVFCVKLQITVGG